MPNPETKPACAREKARLDTNLCGQIPCEVGNCALLLFRSEAGREPVSLAPFNTCGPTYPVGTMEWREVAVDTQVTATGSTRTKYRTELVPVEPHHAE